MDCSALRLPFGHIGDRRCQRGHCDDQVPRSEAYSHFQFDETPASKRPVRETVGRFPQSLDCHRVHRRLCEKQPAWVGRIVAADHPRRGGQKPTTAFFANSPEPAGDPKMAKTRQH